jgi:murein DD-endopeptidase MepM/ murein hydrolase activator NlpD
MIRLLALICSLSSTLIAAPIDLRLPTENRHLFTGEYDRFYTYVDRNFEGQVTKPWQAGSYGLVRTAMRVKGEVLLTKFHEGIDISPIKRDAKGNPLDLVSSIAPGRVAHISPKANGSNYGKYVVVEHAWEGSSVYSIYAHLAEITCNPGDPVNAGSVLGRMGFTGAGIDRTRAHCHLEIGLMMSKRFDDWAKINGPNPNGQGLFNGMNITGVDPAKFFLDHKANPNLQFSQYVASIPVYFKVTVPGSSTPEFVTRHPWLSRGDAAGAQSWEISFSATGFPIAFNPSKRQVTAPTVTAVRDSAFPHRYLTRNLISGEGKVATLSKNGEKLVSQLTNNFPVPPATPAPLTPHVNPR